MRSPHKLWANSSIPMVALVSVVLGLIGLFCFWVSFTKPKLPDSVYS